LHYNNTATFEDERRLTKKLNHREQLKGFSVLTIGKKTVLDIDNQNGEIIDFKKPFYKPWFYIFRKAEKILGEMRANFYDNDCVQKERLTINELTQDGAKKMQRFVLQVEKQRLENVIKNLEEDSK
jgi:GTP-binding protein EngB required for normal cell division